MGSLRYYKPLHEEVAKVFPNFYSVIRVPVSLGIWLVPDGLIKLSELQNYLLYSILYLPILTIIKFSVFIICETFFIISLIV